MLAKKDELGNQDEIVELFDLSNVKDRQIADLSGGELQRFACAMVCIQKGDIFMFDEPSSYLDVKQRLRAALAIRDVIRENRFVAFRISKRRMSNDFLDISLLLNMIFPCWIIYPILFVFYMVHRGITEL
jgi:translation initiation factor RLI1